MSNQSLRWSRGDARACNSARCRGLMRPPVQWISGRKRARQAATWRVLCARARPDTTGEGFQHGRGAPAQPPHLQLTVTSFHKPCSSLAFATAPVFFAKRTFFGVFRGFPRQLCQKKLPFEQDRIGVNILEESPTITKSACRWTWYSRRRHHILLTRAPPIASEHSVRRRSLLLQQAGRIDIGIAPVRVRRLYSTSRLSKRTQTCAFRKFRRSRPAFSPALRPRRQVSRPRPRQVSRRHLTHTISSQTAHH